MQEAEFIVRVSEADSWKEIINYEDKVSSPKEWDSVDIYAGSSKTYEMKAYYKHLLWDRGDFFLIKPNRKIGTIDVDWGPRYGFKFKFYVSKFPDQDTVSMKNQDTESYSEITNMFR